MPRRDAPTRPSFALARPTFKTGTHAVAQVAQIPMISRLAVGMPVMLTKNQGGGQLVRYGLNNGAIGTFIANLYPPLVGPPYLAHATSGPADGPPLAAVCDFPGYTGPPWMPDHPTWIPIPWQESFDFEKSQGATGLPLKPCYAVSVHKSQVRTVCETMRALCAPFCVLGPSARSLPAGHVHRR